MVGQRHQGRSRDFPEVKVPPKLQMKSIYRVNGGANSRGGAPTYDFAKISPKLHEIERIWASGGVPLRSATESRYVLVFMLREGCSYRPYKVKSD